MQKRTVTKTQIKKERDPIKLKEVLKDKGYSNGKTPKGKEAHHKKPVALGGKTTTKNIIVISKTKHKEIHKQNKNKGKI